MPAVLPQELLDKIIGHLDRPSLRACSLVSSPFRIPTQRLVFQSLVIPYIDSPKAESLLTESAHISGYVRDLQIELVPFLSFHNQSIASILSILYRVERMSIQGRDTSWDDMPYRLQTAIQNFVGLPSLHSLNLSHIQYIPSSFIFRALSSLRNFNMYNIGMDPSENSSVALVLHSSSFIPRTEQIIMSSTFPHDIPRILDFILHPRTPGYLDNIRRLVVGFSPQTHVQSKRLIVGTSGTLRYLQIRCGVFRVPVDLPHLPALRTLELKIHLGESEHFPTSLGETIATFPAAIPSIEVVNLVFYRTDWRRWRDDEGGPFPVFDVYLEKLPKLCRVVCHLSLAYPESSATGFFACIRRRFPALQEAKILALSRGSDEQTSRWFP
ncbi:hypothetical protein DFH07DRAFT_1059861 [Mycena maculata]|uniref:F-box domain-containing protein n=1 Tax=Mycena maculata TaxID=230809 RepID=A0AAD7JBA4_9AGAR|nr:hypothetical protein DFH07DRAFT_1059861 [Mycena maculata]